MAPEQARGGPDAVGPAADRVRSGGDPLRASDGSAAVPRRDGGGNGATSHLPGAGAPVASERQGPARPGDDLPEVPAQRTRAPLRKCRCAGRATYGASTRDGRSRPGPCAGESDSGAGAGATRRPRRSWRRGWLWLGWRAAAGCGYVSNRLSGGRKWLGSTPTYATKLEQPWPRPSVSAKGSTSARRASCWSRPGSGWSRRGRMTCAGRWNKLRPT